MKRLFILFFITAFILYIFSGCTSHNSDGSTLKYKNKPVNYLLFEQDDFTVIKTRAENIKPETIRSPICSDYVRNLGYYGINAGFFNTVYRGDKPADADFFSVSVSWSKEDAEKGKEVCEFSIRDPEKVALGEGPYISRGTLFLYSDDKTGKYEAGVISAESCDNVKSQIKLRTGRDYDYIYMIGGGNFYLSEYPNTDDWDKWREEKYLTEGPLVGETSGTDRSGIGIKEENGAWHVYLVTSGTNGEKKSKTLKDLRDLFISLGCSDAIYLDGDGSSQMRCADNDGNLIEKPGDNRYIWAMVRLIKKNEAN